MLLEGVVAAAKDALEVPKGSVTVFIAKLSVWVAELESTWAEKNVIEI